MASETEELMDLPDSDTTCRLCYAEFLDPEDLDVHISQMHSDVLHHLPCDFCTSKFSGPESYVYHLRDHHIASLKCCTYCARLFNNMAELRKHENKHQMYPKKDKFNCSQCKAMFKNAFDLEQHEFNKHHDVKDGVYINKYHSLLSSILNIKAPVLLQSLGTTTIYVCITCNTQTPDIRMYLNHLKRKNCRCFVCNTCTNVYKDKRGLQKHLSTHKECRHVVRSEDKFKICTSCKKKVDALLIKQHLQNCKPVKCNMCDVIFNNISELTLHQADDHPLSIGLITCDICCKEFVGKVALDKHFNRVHKPELHLYKYQCVHCEKMYFKHPKDLFAHFFSKHSDLKPYSCKICNTSFRVRKRFTIHIKLDHKSIGHVEFDKDYNVFFTDKKSENSFQPTCVFPEHMLESSQENKADASQTERDTEAETDAEQKQSEPPKMRFKRQIKLEDFLTATETEANQTENETTVKREYRKRKKQLTIPTKRQKTAKDEYYEIVDTSDDDQPLLVVKEKSIKLKKRVRNKIPLITKGKRAVTRASATKDNRSQLTCKVCKKYCYTFQNYNHHVSMHFKNEAKNCIKCSKEFKTKEELRKHVEKEHSTSKLTETLKSLLERRKNGETNPVPQMSFTEKFQRTIKKVKEEASTAAQIKVVEDNVSVQKFIENFKPENEAKKCIINSSVSMKKVSNYTQRLPLIKITQFKPKFMSFDGKLAMPVRFKEIPLDRPKVSIKLVPQTPIITDSFSVQGNDDFDYADSFVDNDMENNSDQRIPEVAQEVLLNSEEPRPALPNKIVLPSLPKGYDSIRIAHLLPEAPYYQIVTVEQMKDQETPKKEEEEDVALPSGTKLINVNPLAHLLGNTPVEKVVGPNRNKYYKPRNNNYEKAIAKALLKLDKPPKKRERTVKKKDVEVEQ